MPQNINVLDKPPFRKLRGYAFDPSLSNKIDTASINEIVYKVPWEDLRLSEKEQLKMDGDKNYQPQGVGPVGEYIEVVDYDPTLKKSYRQVDLNNPYILAQDGLDPSESNPMFHQQMVYAVSMTTIRNFENALGRLVLWAPRRIPSPHYEEYVQRLRIYPHAIREGNAYYSPQKKALLFGYFSSVPSDNVQMMPDSLVFTCLSHDIIAHEVTHAILDGIHPYYNEPTNADVLAFHEAFSDIVALFQHFTFPDVLKHQIAKTKGDLENQNLLGELAQQFGSAIGSYGSLRDAIGEIDPETKKWKVKIPSGNEYKSVTEPHARGSILVAAIFEAFITIYKQRAADLLRIASNGTGILPQGELHPDLVNRLSIEASKAAHHVLSMSVRALDYCPPVDITFGDFLRAIITADMDLVSEDVRDYRLAFIDAFRKRGIYPKGIKSLSVDSLRYPAETALSGSTQEKISNYLREYRADLMYINDRKQIFEKSKKYISDPDEDNAGLHEKVFFEFETEEYERLTGLLFNPNVPTTELGIKSTKVHGSENKGPSFQIYNLRLVSRVGPQGNQINQIIFNITQRAGVIPGEPMLPYFPKDGEPAPPGGMEFRGGCTMIYDLDSLSLKYAISKPLIDMNSINGPQRKIDYNRFMEQHKFQRGDGQMGFTEFSQYLSSDLTTMTEPFALLHQH